MNSKERFSYIVQKRMDILGMNNRWVARLSGLYESDASNYANGNVLPSKRVQKIVFLVLGVPFDSLAGVKRDYIEGLLRDEEESAPKAFGDYLLERLDRMKMSKGDFAARVGVVQSAITHYINGRNFPRGENLQKRVLGAIDSAYESVEDFLVDHGYSFMDRSPQTD